MAIWIDDGIICSSSKEKLEHIINYLSHTFEMTSGPVDCFVGIKIRRDREKRSIFLSQKAYLSRNLVKFRMEECNTRKVPADPFTKLTRSVQKEEESFLFLEAVGSLMYAVTCTRPDIAFAVGHVARFSSNPDRSHWEAVKRILAYVRGTLNHGIVYGPCRTSRHLCAYSDSDFAEYVVDRRSTVNGVFCLLIASL